MVRFTFKKGLRFVEQQRVWTLLRRVATGALLFEDEHGQVITILEKEVLSKWMRREWLVDEASLSESANVFYLATPRDLSSYPEKTQAVARRRHSYLTAIGFEEISSTEARDAAIRKVAEETGDLSPPSISTIRRWRIKYQHNKCATRLIDGRCRSGRRRDTAPVAFFEDALSRIYLDPQKHPGMAVYEDMRRKIEMANQEKSDDKITCPSPATIYRWLAGLEKDLVDRARLGAYAADRKYRPVLGQVKVTRILERIEVDHSPLDLLIIDEDTSLPLGRPWITVALDRYSRVILGFYVCFHEPSSFSIMQCLKRAILPKDEWLARFPDIKEQWPCFGIPELVASDNGMDLHSEAFTEVLREMGVQHLLCPAREPEYKGAVERFFRTMSQGLVHRLPGTVFSNTRQRGDYSSEKLAAIDLKTLMHLLTKWVVEVYHCTIHRGLGTTPLTKWLEGMTQRTIELPAHSEHMDVLIGIPATRTLFKYGLELDHLYYNSYELKMILARHGMEKGLKLRLKYYEDDVGYIQVFDPYNKTYLRVEAVDKDYAVGLSRHIHRLIVEDVRKRNGDQWNQARLLDAKAEIQALVSQSVHNKKMASRKRGAHLSQRDSESVVTGKYDARKSRTLKREVVKPLVPLPLESGEDDDLPTFNTTNRGTSRSMK